MITDLWYKNAIIYCLSVRSFMDANGDGIGDFVGVERRLDYLQGLGVTAIWLMPFQPSPKRDGGYDISDYYGVDPDYGSLGDFVAFTHAARQRGLRVLIDLVVNHTSDRHPWFQSARSDPASPHRDWYVWSKDRPASYDQGMVFPGVQKTTWTYDEKAKAWYFHRFFDFQPDLNTAHPDVRAEILKIMGFWLELGVSGFRMDAVPFVIAEKGADVRGEPREQFDMLRDFREFLQWRRGDAIILAEANVLPKQDLDYFGDDADRMNMMFNFQVNQATFYALAAADARPLVKAIAKTKPRPLSCQWGIFLRNHDELDLGRLTEKQRQAVFSAFGPDKDMQLYNRGIRRRFAPMVAGDPRRIRLAYSLMFSLPGTPVLRYGDEIGMGDDLSLKERECARTAMQWTAERNGGFSKAERPSTAAIGEGAFSFAHVNVADQRHDPGSLLSWMQSIVRQRKEAPEIGWGDVVPVETAQDAILALRYDWRGNAVLCLHNLAPQPIEVRFATGIAPPEGTFLVDLLTGKRSQTEEDGRHCVYMEGYGYHWFRVGGLDALLKRRET